METVVEKFMHVTFQNSPAREVVLKHSRTDGILQQSTCHPADFKQCGLPKEEDCRIIQCGLCICRKAVAGHC